MTEQELVTIGVCVFMVCLTITICICKYINNKYPQRKTIAPSMTEKILSQQPPMWTSITKTTTYEPKSKKKDEGNG